MAPCSYQLQRGFSFSRPPPSGALQMKMTEPAETVQIIRNSPGTQPAPPASIETHNPAPIDARLASRLPPDAHVVPDPGAEIARMHAMRRCLRPRNPFARRTAWQRGCAWLLAMVMAVHWLPAFAAPVDVTLGALCTASGVPHAPADPGTPASSHAAAPFGCPLCAGSGAAGFATPDLVPPWTGSFLALRSAQDAPFAARPSFAPSFARPPPQ